MILIKTEQPTPIDKHLLKKIYAYREYLKLQTRVENKDLRWRLTLHADASLFNYSWKYEGELPDRIESTEKEEQKIIEALHVSFASNLDEAINGRGKNSHSSRTSHSSRGR